ncbi:MAG: helicase related protein [Alphaproteobacteria bacterium]|jgi:hypothetical protein|nr:helicase related protein [Alphaproteobacteria bacterium]
MPLQKTLDFLRKIPFLKPFFPPSSYCEKTREALILDFWRAVEYFSVHHIPEITPPPKDKAQHPLEQVFSYDPTAPLPWDQNHWMVQSPKKEGHFLRFKVFGGVYPASLIRQTLEDKCGKDETYEADLGASEKLKEGDACAYFFNVTAEGRPLFDSFILPTCAWALGRTLNPGPQDRAWFNDFNDFEMQIKQGFREHFALEDNDVPGQELRQFNVGRIIKSDHLIAYTQKIIGYLGLEGALKTPEVRLQSFYLKNKKLLPGNGCYEVADAEFLNSFFIEDLTKISRVLNGGQDNPRGCGLGLKQFLTPEKDIKVNKRVDVRHNRQQVLSSLAPSKFPHGCWPSKGHHPLATSQQFAINEIGSLTHKAGILAVNGPPGTGKTTLLRDLISSIVVERAKAISFLTKPSDAFKGTGSWKVNDFNRKISLWKPEFKGFEIVVASSNNGAIENVTLEIPGREAVDPSWLPEIDYFTDLASFVLGQPAWGLMGARLGSKANCYTFRTMFWYGKTPESNKPSASQSVSPDLFTAHTPQPTVVPFGKEKVSSNPTRGLQDLLKSLSSQSIDWKAAVAQFNKALALEKEKRAEAETIYALFQKANQFQKKPGWIPHFLAEWQPFTQFLSYLQAGKVKKLKALQEQLSQKIEGISLTGWLEDESIQELSVPWLTPGWFQARAQVFVEALKLHKTFMTANAKVMEQNLRGAMDILQGTIPLETSPEAIAAAWSSLFFVVPVISTTFASFSRLFSHIGQEGLGWLLIDEAGQALPQAAVGAIWRAKRTVVVGDPMQLKPVIPLSLSAQTTLRYHFKTEAAWVPGLTSVQELVDRICSMGTTIKHGNQRKWVGMPLRVHRRCEKPEFTLSNTISYGGLMIFGTPDRPSLPLPESRWLNIPEASRNYGHWIPEEGELARRLVLKLIQERTPPQSIFVVSPFRAVADALKAELKSIHKQLTIGTIHTTQGKEADVVILVLGGNPEKPGAKKWASQEPNLLNVAVTRAKRRFYIIGNQEEWGKYPYFRDASDLFMASPSPSRDGDAYAEDIWRFLAFNSRRG